MKLTLKVISLVLVVIGMAACNQQSPEAPKEPASKATEEPTGKSDQEASNPGSSNRLMLELKDGVVEIELRPDLAPKHVTQVTTLANRGFYDGIVFHRVIDGFMAQGGDPTGTGTGSSDLPDIPAEFSSEPFDRGVLGMARSQNPDSANSQFFIMLDEGHFLNNEYTVFGKVTKGMEFVDGIKKGNKATNGTVTDPDKIIKMRTADQF